MRGAKYARFCVGVSRRPYHLDGHPADSPKKLLQSDPSMAKYKLEYSQLDGYTPLASLRSKTQIKDFAGLPTLEEHPKSGFDGSSTQQAEGKSSDCVLKPVAAF